MSQLGHIRKSGGVQIMSAAECGADEIVAEANITPKFHPIMRPPKTIPAVGDETNTQLLPGYEFVCQSKSVFV